MSRLMLNLMSRRTGLRRVFNNRSFCIVFHEEHQDSDPLDDDDSDNSTEEMVMEALRHAQEILRQPNVYNTLASRVLDDAYHFMDRLLRLLSKKRSVFKEFAHQFSETIFVRDQDDEAKVREVLEKKGIPWE
jgi:hypothetical protein